MKKINLKEFHSEQLSVSEKIATKGGSGITYSRRYMTSCAGTDCDNQPHDKDC